MGLDLEGKIAVVTGGSRGIGKGIALALAEEGAHVAVFYRAKAEEAAGVIKEVEAMGRKGLALQVDITDYEKLEAGVKKVVETFGRIDILVNNAGRSPRPAKIGDADIKDWKGVIELNLNAVFYCAKAALPYMRAKKSGVIINLSSANVQLLNPTSGPYSAAKRGVEAVTKILAKEEAENGIRVNAVAPGVIESRMATEMLKAMGEAQAKAFMESIPFRRIGYPKEDVGRAIAFLCSEKANYITGEILSVNGGLVM
jgi:3-oxoacyl-[acyl-carrier protein] reductase